ncbi:MAG TPA: hypothetical protein VGF01_20610 [Terracidiphilus sp.]
MRPNVFFAQMTQCLDDESYLPLKPGEHLWTSVFEYNATPPNRYFIVRSVGQVDDFRRHLRRKPQQVCRPCTIRHNLPALSPRNRPRGFVDVRAEFSAKSGIDARSIIEPTANTPDGTLLARFREGHVDGRPARNVEEVLRREGFSLAKSFNPRNYLIPHGFHATPLFSVKKNYTSFS